MSFVSKFLIMGAISATVAAHIDVALACTAPYPAVLGRVVLPDGGEEVALDAQVIVHLRTQNLTGGMQPLDTATFVERAGIELRTSDGEPVETTTTAHRTDGSLTIFLKPVERLVTRNEYVVFDKIKVSAGSSLEPSLSFLDEAVEVGRFTVGPRAVGARPRAMGTVVAEESRQSCDNSACCGPYDAAAMSLTFEAPGPGFLARIERESEAGLFEAVAWVDGGYASGWAACAGSWSPSPDFLGGGRYRVRYEGPSSTSGEPSEVVILAGQCGEEAPEAPNGEANAPAAEDPEGGEGADGVDSGCAGGGAGTLGWVGLGLLFRRRAARR